MKDRIEMNAKQIAELKAELDDIRGVLIELKPTIETIQATQEKYSQDTNKNAHEAKHNSANTQSNMIGFKDLTAQQYEHMNAVVNEFRIIIAELKVERKYTEEKLEELEEYTGEIRAIVSTQLFREIIDENKASKLFRTRAQNVWWFVLSIGAFAAVVAGIIAAVKAISNLMK